MHILICSAYFESHRGGIEIVAGRLASEFAGLGHSVTWMAADASNPPAGTGEVCRAVPLRAFNASERWLQIPQPIPALRAFRYNERWLAPTSCTFTMRSIRPTSPPLLARWQGKPVVSPAHRHGSLSQSRAAPHDAGDKSAGDRADAGPRRPGGVHQPCHGEGISSVNYRRPPWMIFNGVDTGLFRPASNASEKA